jgi:hypothetical protein
MRTWLQQNRLFLSAAILDRWQPPRSRLGAPLR